MLVMTDEEDIRLLQSCDENVTPSDSLTESQETIASQVKYTVQRWKWPFRNIGSSRLVIILIWAFLIDCSLRLTLYKLQYSHFKTDKHKIENSYSPLQTHWTDVAVNVTFALSCPIAGLIAEVYIGRYKVISYALRLLWLLTIVGSLLSIWDYTVPHAKEKLYYVQCFIVVVPGYALKGAFLANAIPLGMDQITDGSHTNVCAYILWLTWASIGSGYSVAAAIGPVLYKCFHHSQLRDISLIISLLPVLLLSVGLVLDFFLGRKLIKEPVSVNPVSLIYRVLKYAAKHKSPVQRSALTYWENELPTRLDNGKAKYGGPFTIEQVEDVKTFWRVLVIILVISLFNIPLEPLKESTTTLEKNFAPFRSQTRCVEAGSSSTYTPYAFITYAIPLYELLIYPCLKNSGPSILTTAGIGAAVAVSSSVFGMMVDTARQVLTNNTVECMFTTHEHHETGSINHFLIGIPFNFLLGFTVIVLLTSNLQFVCAQAPYNMKGLLVGLSYMLQTLFTVLGTLLYAAWSSKKISILRTHLCGTWFYLTILLVTAGFSVLLSWLVRWYKKRERDEVASTNILVEDLYYKYGKKHKEQRFGVRRVPYQL